MPDYRRKEGGSTLIMWQGAGEQTYSIRIDATVSETHAYVNQVTDHPVERGANITDHVRPEPRRLSLVGFISNAPQFLPADHVNGAQEQVSSLTVNVPGITRVLPIPSAGIGASIARGRAPQGAPFAVMTRVQSGYTNSAKVMTFSAEFDRAREVFEELVTLRELGTFLRVQTTIADYENMVIESLTVPRDVSTGDALMFELALKEVIVAVTREVAAPVLPVERKAKGTTSPKAAKPEEKKAVSRGILAAGKDWLEGAFR